MIDRVAALHAERAALLEFCRPLDTTEWQAPSAATGWRIQDVVAHIGSGCHAMFTPAALGVLRSKQIERTNDAMVQGRWDWDPRAVLAEYSVWSARLASVAGFVERTPLARLPMPLAELGRFPAGLLLSAALVFDHHTHLRFDMAQALDRPAPPSDSMRMTVVLEWMFAVLANQVIAARPHWLEHPVTIMLTGLGGGAWTFGPSGVVKGGRTAATVVTARSDEFPQWATTRTSWRTADVVIAGDLDYGAAALDWINVI